MKKTTKQLFSLMKGHALSLSAILFFAILSVGFSLVIPVLVGDGIDKIVQAGEVDFKGLTTVFFGIFLSVVVSALSQAILSALNCSLANKIGDDLRRRAFEKLFRLPLSYLDGKGRGDTLSRILNDTDEVADGLLIGFTQLFTGVMTIVGTLVFMFMTKIEIAVAVVVLTPLSALTAKLLSSRIRKAYLRQAELKAEQTAFEEEVFSSLKTVKSFSREKANGAVFKERDERLYDVSLKATFFSSIVNPSTRFVNNLVYATVALIGGLSVLSGGFTVGGLTKFLSYANGYTKPFNEISGVYAELQSALVSLRRIFELTEQEEEESDEGGETVGKPTGAVAFSGVDFSYDGKEPLIENFSLNVSAGQKVAIVGPTGAGKTTLINLLMRFYDVQKGKIELDGKDIKTLTRNSLRSSYGMVLQDTWIKNATVRENIRLGRDISDEEIERAAKLTKAHSFIMRLKDGYDTLLKEDSLSQGQRQLLCIARVMANLPSVLILDEATSSVDIRTEKEIGEAFDRLTKGRTSFVVAHRLSTVRSADTILVMQRGKIVERGTHEELLEKHGTYYELYQSQFA